MIVIDVGAQHHPPEESTYFLAERFRPRFLWAFDGYHAFAEGIEAYGPTVIQRVHKAAWVHDQGMPYSDRGMCSSVTYEGTVVPTFDLAQFILNVTDNEQKDPELRDEPLVVKLDCEGAEYVLLPHLVDKGVDRHISLLLIEWHPEHLANGWYVPREQRPALVCEVVDWNDLTKLPTEAEKT